MKLERNFLQDNNGNFSSVRLALIIICIISALLGLAMTGSIIIKAVKGIVPDWGGMAVFLGALAVFIGVVISGKVIQQRNENRI